MLLSYFCNVYFSKLTISTMDLKRFTQDYRLSQKELAVLFDCNPSNVSNIVAGKRNLTGLQIRLLIDKFGYDVIAKYAEPGEMPQGAAVNIDMRRTKIEGNTAPVQNGDGNQMTNNDASLIQVLSQQSAQITELLKQQDRLITMMETMQGIK